MRTFHVENFGCRATQADGATLETLLKSQGLQNAPTRNAAELVILNTCTVTAAADADLRTTVRRIHRENPQARILVTGCYAQRAPEELAALPGVEWVVGNTHKMDIAQMVSGVPYHGGVYRGDVFAEHAFLSAPAVEASQDRARPNLKIQDGCNNRCSFCIIPSVRGGSRFLSANAVVNQVRALSARYPEVVLTGINLGRWGRESGSQVRLTGLLRRLLAETAIHRIRLSSVEPMDWTGDLIELMAGSPRVAPHIHMPLQSGSDWILRRMHRKYRPRHYRERIEIAASLMPDAAIGADVMTGFPGETDALFEESRAFVESLPFTYLHVFTYSERPGTAAAEMPDSIPMEIRRARNRTLRELSDRKNREFRGRMRGRTLSAVTLEQAPCALTENYIRVEMDAWPGAGKLVSVTPQTLDENGGMRENGVFPMLAAR